ncbi:MAG: CoA-binding protein [Acidimicrobiia bacterium]
MPPTEQALRAIINGSSTAAIVGASANPARPSHGVLRYLMARSHLELYPVNPNYEEVAGLTCYASLADLPLRPDLVVIFRRPEAVPPVVEQAIEVGAKVVWMQLGIRNEEAAAAARATGLEVVQDRCIAIDHRHLVGKASED